MKPPPTPARRRLAAASILVLIVLLMVPNLIWLGVGETAHPLIDAIVLPLAFFLLLFALLGGRPWIACLVLLPFAVCAPLEAFYIEAYHRPSFAEIIATLVATNPREMREYVGALLVPLILCVAAAAAVPLLAAWWSRRSDLRLPGRMRASFAGIAVLSVVTIGLLAGATAKGDIKARWQASLKRETMLPDRVQYGFPFGLVPRLYEYRREWSEMRANVSRLDAFRFGARRTALAGHRQIYVLVIGEASRRDHWQLFGYPRKTTPELAATPNIVPLTDFDTPWPESITAIPMILTRKPVTDIKFTWWKEASILRAMREAGYETYWISNQQAIGKYDSPVSTYAFEADHELFLNHISWSIPGSYDEILLPSLRNVLHDSNRDLFIVLHMMGNHQHYDYRYPESYRHWRPIESDPAAADSSASDDDSASDESGSDSGSDDGSDDVGADTDAIERTRNSYDNSILYTDHVLAAIIRVLREENATSALWFESDHGESLPSPTCSLEGHGNGTRYEYEIPALVWYSDAWAGTFPDRLAGLRANAGKRMLSAGTFESLADMAGLDFPGHDRSWSAFSPKWSYKTRIVNRPIQGDIDTATFSKDCGVVHPKPNGKPPVKASSTI